MSGPQLISYTRFQIFSSFLQIPSTQTATLILVQRTYTACWEPVNMALNCPVTTTVKLLPIVLFQIKQPAGDNPAEYSGGGGGTAAGEDGTEQPAAGLCGQSALA